MVRLIQVGVHVDLGITRHGHRVLASAGDNLWMKAKKMLHSFGSALFEAGYDNVWQLISKPILLVALGHLLLHFLMPPPHIIVFSFLEQFLVQLLILCILHQLVKLLVNFGIVEWIIRQKFAGSVVVEGDGVTN